MRKLSIYKLGEEKLISTLEIGEHVFGRGDLLQCDDRRVSRNHGIIKITENTTTITSTHLNPCFHQAADSATITILPRNNPVDLSDGDKFALLADKYWYQVKLVSNCDVNENDQGEPSLIKENGVENNELSNTNNADSNDSSDSMDFLQATNSKRGYDEEVNDTSEAKKSKFDNNETNDEDDQLFSILNDLKEQNVKCETATKMEENVVQNTVLKSDDSKTTSNAKKTKNKTSANGHDADLKAMLFSSDEEEVEEKVNTDETATKKEQDNIEEEEEEKNEEQTVINNGVDEDDANIATAGTSNSDKKQKRDRCWYGSACYRKNEAHFAEFRHPGDTDYESDPDDDRPICSYGASCYRRNKDHRKAYRHPNSTQGTKGPPGKRATKKKATPDADDSKKKRTVRKKYNDDSSEDDYDLQDPFINDSGTDDYEATSSSSDESDSDSDWKAGSEEETKRLLKEAKKFTKGKKKEKDEDD